MRKRNTSNKSLKLASQYRDLLLYELMGDNMAKKPEFPIPNSEATFGEKKGLYAELLKHAQIELKMEEGGEETSGLDFIRNQLNGGGTSRSRGNNGRNESSPDDSGDSTEEADNA